jgi:alpha-mannosidase
MPAGTPWGGKWEYGWFRSRVALPEEAKGQRVALRVDVGGESLVWIDGRIAGARDDFHREVTLAVSGVPGAQYDVLVEAYAGHGPRVCHAGPTPPGRDTVPEPPPTQAVVGESNFGVWQEDVYQLWIDVETLYDVRECIDPESLRVAEIDRGLRDFTTIADFELPREEMLETVRAARERLAPLLACTNGSTAPRMFAFGHAHIDVAWLWPLAETERKCARTFAGQLALMEEYPEYRFLQSQPHLYRMVKDHYPDLYARIEAAVSAGQFIADGSAWVEPDTNVTGGESLIRQIIHGKRFYRDEFGVECEMLWLPDVFGYSGALPQICRGCGIKYFSTQKILWVYHGGDPFPYNTFVWEGIDGSELLVHLHNDYNARTNPASLIQRWNERVQKDGITTRLYPFGWGDGGGGPTRNHLEFLRRLGDLEGVPRTGIASPLDFFHDQEARGWPEARYVGELYYQCHRGTYTSQARTKRGNRQCEVALREAEMWACAARALTRFEIPHETLDEAWKRVLLNQFHDILPGSSIHRVYEEAEADYDRVIHTAHQVATRAAAGLTGGAEPEALAVFNSLSWQRTSLLALPDGFDGAIGETGESLPIQAVEGRTYAEVALPPCGWTTLRAGKGATPGNVLRARENVIENDLLRVGIDARGEIAFILDKETGRDWAAANCNSLRMYRDVPSQFDAWDIDSMVETMPVPLEGEARIEVMAEGPLVASLRVSRRLHESTMAQEIRLRRGSRRIDMHTIVDWQESHKLLKVAFPVTVHADEAIHEIQFGYIRRPNHRSRPFDADRFEVPNQRWTALVEENRGCAILNDSKYGVSVLGNSINLTLLKSALAPDVTADRGGHEFTYAFYAWNGSLYESDVVRQGYDLNYPAGLFPGAAGERSLFSVDAPNVIVETVKPAEDGSGDVVVRLYEAKRTATRCSLTTSLPAGRAFETDMLESPQRELECSEGKIPLDFRAFEIKTVRLCVDRDHKHEP